MINVADLCGYILYRAYEETNCDDTQNGYPNLWLQKTLYYVCGNYLAKFGTPLLSSEFEAWMYGPVYPEAYLRYREYKRNPIPRPIACPILSSLSTEAREVIDSIIRSCAHKTTAKLVDQTHRETPWVEASQDGTRVGTGVTISNESIRHFFVNNQP